MNRTLVYCPLKCGSRQFYVPCSAADPGVGRGKGRRRPPLIFGRLFDLTGLNNCHINISVHTMNKRTAKRSEKQPLMQCKLVALIAKSLTVCTAGPITVHARLGAMACPWCLDHCGLDGHRLTHCPWWYR